MFANDKQKKLRQEFEDYLNKILSCAAHKYDFKCADLSFVNSTLLGQFELFHAQQNPKLLGCWTVSDTKNCMHIACISIDSTLLISSGRRSFKETQTHLFLYGFIQTKSDFGISLIQREGIIAKIIDLFINADIDFNDHKTFSSNYQCFSKDENLFRKAMTKEIMNFLTTIDHCELEFRNRVCLFRTQKSIIDQKNNLELFRIGLELSQLLSK